MESDVLCIHCIKLITKCFFLSRCVILWGHLICW